MPIQKMTEVPYPGVVPWLTVRKKINELVDGTVPASGYAVGDNGKVLGIVDGAIAPVEGGSGGDVETHVAQRLIIQGVPAFVWDGEQLEDAEDLLDHFLEVIDFSIYRNQSPPVLITGTGLYRSAPLLLGYVSSNTANDPTQYTFTFTGVDGNDGQMKMTWTFTLSDGVWGFNESTSAFSDVYVTSEARDFIMRSQYAGPGAILAFNFEYNSTVYRGMYIKNGAGSGATWEGTGTVGSTLTYSVMMDDMRGFSFDGGTTWIDAMMIDTFSGTFR